MPFLNLWPVCVRTFQSSLSARIKTSAAISFSLHTIAAIILCGFGLMWSSPAIAIDENRNPEGAGNTRADSTVARSEHFMAVTANPHATEAAAAVLRRGGNAIDAGIAAQLMLGLTEPQSSGIGGGGFALYWDASRQKLHAWDGREISPAAVEQNYFLEDGKPLGYFDAAIGGYAVGVPGIPALLWKLHRQHGRLLWSQLFDDAIAKAENGFAISPRLELLFRFISQRGRIHPQLAAYLLDEKGEPPKAGTILKNPAYADTLRLFRERGIRPFYRGAIAKRIIAAVNSDELRPGKLQRKDFLSYRVIERKPVCGPYRQYRICGFPPPSSGGTTILATLGILAHFDTPKLAATAPERIHLFGEALRLAFADRNTWVGDPDYMPLPYSRLIARDYLAGRARLLDRNQAANAVRAGQPATLKARPPRDKSREPPSTSHFVIIDRFGNILSMTSSIEGAFGSGIMVNGFLLNNQLNDFYFEPDDADTGKTAVNSAAPHKRPRSSMAPTIVFDLQKRPILALGSPGGSRIIPYVAQTLSLYLDGVSSLKQAIVSGRVAHVNQQHLELEAADNWPRTTIKALERYGHKVRKRFLGSGLHAVAIEEDGRLLGIADPRREGTASGH